MMTGSGDRGFWSRLSLAEPQTLFARRTADLTPEARLPPAQAVSTGLFREDWTFAATIEPDLRASNLPLPPSQAPIAQ